MIDSRRCLRQPSEICPTSGLNPRFACEGKQIVPSFSCGESFPSSQGLIWIEIILMVGNRYRISKSIVGVRESSQGQVLHTLLLDSVVSVHSLSEDGRSVHVDWDEVSLTLFTQDLVERAALVEAPEIFESSSVAAYLVAQ